MKKYINGLLVEMTNEEISNLVENIETKISHLKTNLAETDYVACKIAEGVATKEEYSDIVAQRQMWREEINKLTDAEYNEIMEKSV